MSRISEDLAERVGVEESSGQSPAVLQALTLTLLVAYLYTSILWRLVENWWKDPNFSHGFFVPVFAGYVLWERRRKLAALTVVPSFFWGMAIVVGSLGVLIVGVLGAELFLSRVSFIFLLAGLTIYFFGWRHFREALFPWGCLFLMIPIPAIIFNQIAFPLQLLASRLAGWLLALTSVPVLREGNVLKLPAMTLEVVQACSGIRSLVSLMTLAVIYGYFMESRALRRVVLVLAAAPIAIVANGLRVVGTGLLVHYWDPAKAEGFFHTFEGWVIFVLSLTMLFSLHGLFNLMDRWRARRRS
jgi:exosortase